MKGQFHGLVGSLKGCPVLHGCGHMIPSFPTVSSLGLHFVFCSACSLRRGNILPDDGNEFGSTSVQMPVEFRCVSQALSSRGGGSCDLELYWRAGGSSHA